MLLQIEDKNDILDFLLQTNVFNTWGLSKMYFKNSYTIITTDPIYYEFNAKYNIKFGDRSNNVNCHLAKTITYNDIGINEQYKATPNIYTNNLTTARFYPREIIERVRQNTQTTDTFTFDIKLVYPQELHNLFDNDNSYKNFYIDFYSTDNGNGISFTYTENIKNFSLEPPQEWIAYCQNLFFAWIEHKKKTNPLG